MSSLISQRLSNRIASGALSNRLPVVHIRHESGARNQFGEYQPGSTSRHSVIVVTAPLSGDETQSLPEGLRAENIRRFWVRENVTDASDCEGSKLADEFEFDDGIWRAEIVRDWGGFREVLSIRTP